MSVTPVLGIRRLFILVVVLSSTKAYAQNSGAFAPWVTPTFTTNGTAPLANGFLCTYAAGTSTPLATYQDTHLSVPNQNPIKLSTGGQPINGSSLVSIYLQPKVYRFILYSQSPPGSNTCNGTDVGALVRVIDDVYDFGQLLSLGIITVTDLNVQKLNQIRMCDQFPGANAGVKIVNCIADLPATGGTADARSFEGTQVVNVNLFTGVTKPVTLLLGAATFDSIVPQIVNSSDIHVIGLGRATIWQYQGGSAGFVWGDTGDGSTLYFRNEVSKMTILGNSSVTNGLQIASEHHSVYRDLYIGNVLGACFWIGFAVTNYYENPHCSNNDVPGGAFSPTPTNGMLFQGLDSTHNATGSTIMKPVIESVSGSGIKIQSAQALKFIAGTSENNNINIEVAGTAQAISFDSMDLEDPGTKQIVSAACAFCTWTNMFMTNTDSKGAHFTGGDGNIISGGEWTNLIIDSAVMSTVIENIFFATNGSGCGGFTNNSVSTIIYRYVKYDCGLNQFFPFASIAVVDQLDVLNQQGTPTTAYLRNATSQSGADLLHCTDHDRSETAATIYCRIGEFGTYAAGRIDQGYMTMQPGDATHMGYIEMSIGGTRYAYFGQGTAGNVQLILENGAKFGLNNTGTYSRVLTFTDTWDPPNLPNNEAEAHTFSATGVAFGDTCMASLAEDLLGLSISCNVQAANSMSVLISNNTGGAVDLASTTVRVDVWQH